MVKRYISKSKMINNKIITGGAYKEVNPIKIEEQQNKQDQQKNVTITTQPIKMDKMDKISQEKLNKFVNLKLN